MRLRIAAFVPLVAQFAAYVVVYFAVTGNGSFVGLLALPALIFSFPVLLAVCIADARRKTPAPRYRGTSWAIALLPPLACLILQAVVT